MFRPSAAAVIRGEPAAQGSSKPIEVKRRPLPTTTSVEYTIPTDPYLLAEKFRQVARSGKLDDAVAIVMQSKTRHQSAVVWNLVIGEYAKTGRLRCALRAHTEMRKRGFRPTATTFTALLRACALSESDNRARIAEQLFASMADHGVRPTIVSHNALLSVYQRQHDVDALLARFNALPADGPAAPSLETYTVVMDACRRELQRQIEALAALGPSQARSFGDARRAALVAGNVRAAFDALLGTWSAYVEDAERRLKSPRSDTQPLGIDARAVRVVLKACHSAYGVNRALGRRGLAVAEQVYGFDRGAGARAADAPLAARLHSTTTSSSSPGSDAEPAAPVVDEAVVDLVFGLCRRDKQHTKAARFWRSLETHFAGELGPLRTRFAEQLKEIAPPVIPAP
ncbi:hypothetical protein H4R18_005374 [Coemansia javaensis]|uniref:Pentacotripeptide-repeat region of PRORP domain-containing protein n=1 Tax=Coemansia javaensis TaxID=2761396 RepID=A0A9W8LEX0_9FUNG|nr:hypothetical protein H4R18_005374 [Coemansia javaensis]